MSPMLPTTPSGHFSGVVYIAALNTLVSDGLRFESIRNLCTTVSRFVTKAFCDDTKYSRISMIGIQYVYLFPAYYLIFIKIAKYHLIL